MCYGRQAEVDTGVVNEGTLQDEVWEDKVFQVEIAPQEAPARLLGAAQTGLADEKNRTGKIN